MLEVAGGNKNKVADMQGQYSPTETVDAGWVITREIGVPGDAWRREKSWAVTDPDLDSFWSGGKLGCVRGWALVRSRRLEQEDFIYLKKRLLVAD